MIRLLEVFSLGVVVAACLVGQGNSASSSDASDQVVWPVALSSVAKSAAASETANSTDKVHSVPVDEPEEGNEPLPFITDWAAGLPPIPVGKSDVIVGEVIAATAELLKNGVRSEFTIQIDSVLKQPSKATLRAGGSLPRFRVGGMVQFPTGKTYLFNEYGQGAPVVGKNYVFFLSKNSANSPTFHI